MLISIHDKTLSRVTFLDNEKPDTLHYFDEVWHRYLTEATSTFDFSVPKTGNPDIEYLNVSGYVSFHYGGRSYLFSIMKVEETEQKLTCYCENLNLELLNETSGEYKADSAKTFAQYFSTYPIDLHLAQLRIGINEVANLSRSLEWTGTDTKLARLLSLVNKFDAECEFVTRLNRDGTLDEIVLNVYRKHDETNQGVGRNRTDITLYYGKQVKEIRRTVDKTGLYTAIKPIGTDGLTISTLDKTEYDSDGKVLFISPQGSEHILCPSMRDEYPSQMVNPTGDRYIKLDWSYETNNVNTLYGQALAKLKSVYMPAITYEVDGFFDLDIGDTVKIHDDGFTPLLLLEARVSEQEISFSKPDTNKTTFANFRALENRLSSGIQSRLEALIQQSIPYTADIITTEGIVFKNGEGSTKLTARVTRGTNIVTSQLKIQWYKDGTALSTNETITVNAADVTGKAVYRFEATDSAGDVKCFAEATVVDVSDGEKGEDGKAQYLHVKYSDDGGKTFTANQGETPGKWMGYYIDFTEADSNNPDMYSWVKVEGPPGEQGIQGPKGADGTTYYTWLKYADSPTSGMSDIPTGKAYIGLAYNKPTATESSVYGDYTWSLVKGEKGDQGVAGGKGADGTTYYTWVKYATSASGANMSDDPTGKTYIGLAYNKATATESNNASDYTWSLIKGDKGDKGDTGAAATAHSMLVSAYAIAKDTNGVYTPPTITLTGQAQTGDNPLVSYACRFKIEETTDMSAWTTKYTSSANESTKTYTPSAGIKALSCSMYLAGGTTTLLDRQIIPIVTDGRDGTSKYTHIRYAMDENGLGMTDKPNPVLMGKTTQDGTGDPSPTNVRPLRGIKSELLPQTLYSLPGDICDEYDFTTGKGIQRVGCAIIDGSRNLSMYNAMSETAEFRVANQYYRVKFGSDTKTYSDKFKLVGVTWANDSPYIYAVNAGASNDYREVSFRLPVLSTTNAMAWLTENPVTVLYQLPTPVEFTGSIRVMPYIGIAVTDNPVAPVDAGEYTWSKYTGDNGQDGADAYTVVLSNESHTFVGDTSAALAGSTDCKVIAYKGSTQVAATIGTISGMPTGMTASIQNNGTVNAQFTVTVTTAMTTKSGMLTIPITVDGKSFSKNFSFALALTGATGGKGDKGDPMGILELPTEPPTKYEGMLWKHTGMLDGYINNATYRWTGSVWELFKFRADNIEADSFTGYEFNGSIFKSSFEEPAPITWDGNPYGKYIGDIRLEGSQLLLSYTEYTSNNGTTWNPSVHYVDRIGPGLLSKTVLNATTGTKIGGYDLTSDDLAFYPDNGVGQQIRDLNRNLNTRQLKTYTELSQIGLTDANTLQELCNVLPEKSILLVEIGAKPGSGWKSQLPEGMGLIRIEKYYLSRVNILFYPMNGGYFFQGAFSTGTSPNLRPFVKYTGVAI